MKPLSLKLRFAIVMSLGALALVVGMGALSMHNAQNDLLATLSSEQVGTVVRGAADLDDDLRFAVDALSASAAATPKELLSDPEGFAAFGRRHPALMKVFDSVFVIDPAGIVTAVQSNDEARFVGLNLAERPYFQNAVASGKPVISEPLRAKLTGEPLVNVAVPIVDASGGVSAVMVGTLSLTRHNLVAKVGATKLGKTGYFVVVATWPKPIYLAHPDRSHVMEDLSGDLSDATARILGARGPGVALTTLGDGSEALVAWQPLQMTNWVIAAVLPRAEAFATIDHARGRITTIAIVAAIAVLPLTWSLAWFLFRPLSRLRREVDAISRAPEAGGLTTVGRADEVGRVALAFNAMLAGQRASEASRKASDEDRRRLVAILESSGDYVAVADVSGRLTYLNAAARRGAGIDPDEDVGGRSLTDFLPPWANARLETEAIPAALADGIWLGEMGVLDVDGRESPVDQTLIAHRNADGKLEFFSSLMHDTSAAQSAAASLRASEARMLSIADALPVHVSFLDREYRYRFVNSIYEQHFGIDRSRILGRTVLDLIGPDAYAAYEPFLARAARGEPQVFEVDSRSGVRPAHLLVKLLPQLDDDGHVTGFHFIHQDITDHKVENQRLSQLIHADSLTGLLNRAGFETAIGDAMARAQQHRQALALFYLDVDRFKQINDRHGHPVGDRLLRGFASRLVRAIRGADIAARLGGDEFVVIAEGVRSADDVRTIAGKILLSMRPEFELDGARLSITSSVGVAIYAGERIDVETLVGRADAALYRAKAAGRNRYELDERATTFGTTTIVSPSSDDDFASSTFLRATGFRTVDA